MPGASTYRLAFRMHNMAVKFDALNHTSKDLMCWVIAPATVLQWTEGHVFLCHFRRRNNCQCILGSQNFMNVSHSLGVPTKQTYEERRSEEHLFFRS